VKKNLLMNLLEKEAELIGALIGDGYISLASGKYILGFTGHPKDDKEYYNYLSNLMLDVWGKEPYKEVRFRGLRMKIYSKPACLRLINFWGLAFGKEKSLYVVIPPRIFYEPALARAVVRGVVDTDGSVFCSKKPGIEKYPSIEITTISHKLGEQLRDLLLCWGFRVPKIRSYLSKRSKHRAYKVCLYGRRNLSRWCAEIGFSNPTKHNKALSLLSDY